MKSSETYGADTLHGKDNGGEEQWHVSDGADPGARCHVGKWHGCQHSFFVGKRADTEHHPHHGATQTHQYERRRHGREGDQQSERTNDAERKNRYGETQDPGTDGELPL